MLVNFDLTVTRSGEGKAQRTLLAIVLYGTQLLKV